MCRCARCAGRARLPDRAIELAAALGGVLDVCGSTCATCTAGALGAAGAFTVTGARAAGESLLAGWGDVGPCDDFPCFGSLLGFEDRGPWDGFELCDGLGGLIFFSAPRAP
ncbi:MAG: hypothetical protein ACRDLS_01900 [Solirubrobacteraceae bacterium]